ncbi:MAG: thiamine diphosphokinase [Rhodobacteraceae bacterium]|nr:thiamine diphosphokinase [Paracoccaceae bacterium]
MTVPILHSEKPVTLVGGGAIHPGDLDLALVRAPTLVAADGGAMAALDHGLVPDAVIGDFDSISDAALARIPDAILHPVAEQDSTDFDKCLERVLAPVILAVGFLGQRLDHQLAGFSALLRQAKQPCILIGADEIVFHLPRNFAADLEAGDVVSLFPLLPVQGRSTGLRWPIDGLELRPDGRIGTSNVALGPIRIWTDGPGLLCILPRRALDQVMPAFAPDA